MKKLALRKQGLQHGVQVQTILSSARYAYENTPDSDSKLRAHYLALIIRSRSTFKKSGTMQNEMMKGGCGLFFDLFVAMCNHMVSYIFFLNIVPLLSLFVSAACVVSLGDGELDDSTLIDALAVDCSACRNDSYFKLVVVTRPGRLSTILLLPHGLS